MSEDKEQTELTLAEKLHDGNAAKATIEEMIEAAFEKYEPEIHKQLDFDIGSDFYDNSIEIYFNNSLPYPYEPCHEIREIIYGMGFSSVYWNFLADRQDVICDRLIGEAARLMKNSPDEIRDFEPRHNKHTHWIGTKYGYVDERFNEQEWVSKYLKK